ncbi:putative glucose-methanol-choline oxidoreductase, FAD/NAD(P)-binding domain superfamily [Helianthus annuus]|nr:putative glucose-methanol-choline oxidoreductase, FAD/NAD(P)-binding domain superfamily [Helianthus annuus]KAJ0851022.1 putative glucose-methanol-choline oxidoreductase, FAD/NAD(P)-binding domain superfamily [Helianthus annuus]
MTWKWVEAERETTAGEAMERLTDTVRTVWHYHGGCHIGKVVDDEYKVIGVDALRVIDGSTLLNSPGTNPQASLLMLGRYLILKKTKHNNVYDQSFLQKFVGNGHFRRNSDKTFFEQLTTTTFIAKRRAS